MKIYYVFLVAAEYLLLVYEYMEKGSLHKYLFGMHVLIYLIASVFMIKHQLIRYIYVSIV